MASITFSKQYWRQSYQQQYWMLLIVWGDKKFLVCGLWVNSSHQQGGLLVLCNQNVLLVGDCICMFFIHIRHGHFLWEVWDYIPPWYIQGWPIQGSQHIHSHFCCWRVWLDKILIIQCKLNKHCLCKQWCWYVYWLWWDQQLVCSFLLGD